MLIVIMGVSGSGKSTVGKSLADRLNWPFFDADDFHPQSNKDKMASGMPLTDQDRFPWLHLIVDRLSKEPNSILACSALKSSYRSILNMASDEIKWAYLEGDYETIKKRMEERAGHFMKPDLLRSQFDTLEIPTDAIKVDVTLPVDHIVATITNHIQ